MSGSSKLASSTENNEREMKAEFKMMMSNTKFKDYIINQEIESTFEKARLMVQPRKFIENYIRYQHSELNLRTQDINN